MKAQSGIEYMIIIGFVSLAITLVLVAAYFYINMSKDKIRENQVEVLANKIISSSESVFFAGEPSQVTIIIYVPQGISNIELSGYDLLISASTSAGIAKRAFTSKVPLEGTISSSEGSKKLLIKALSNEVMISQT